MATSLTEPEVLRAWLAAPEPRPPHPIKATLSVSLPAAWALRSTESPPSTDAPATAAEVVFKKLRRGSGEMGGCFVWGLIVFCSLWAQAVPATHPRAGLLLCLACTFC